MPDLPPIIAMSYNIHGNVGHDRIADPWRIAGVINEVRPDIVGLQEAIMAREHESSCAARVIERETGLHPVFGRTADRGRDHYGNLLLSRWPATEHRVVSLHVPPFEPRGAIVACLDTPHGVFRVVVTHLGLRARERGVQIERLRLSLEEAEGAGSVSTLFLGDFNCWGGSQRMLRVIGAPLDRRFRPRSFPANWPAMALDRIWAIPNHLIEEVVVHRSDLSRRASDHLPIIAQLHGAARVTEATDAVGGEQAA